MLGPYPVFPAITVHSTFNLKKIFPDNTSSIVFRQVSLSSHIGCLPSFTGVPFRSRDWGLGTSHNWFPSRFVSIFAVNTVFIWKPLKEVDTVGAASYPTSAAASNKGEHQKPRHPVCIHSRCSLIANWRSPPIQSRPISWSPSLSDSVQSGSPSSRFCGTCHPRQKHCWAKSDRACVNHAY